MTNANFNAYKAGYQDAYGFVAWNTRKTVRSMSIDELTEIMRARYSEYDARYDLNGNCYDAYSRGFRAYVTENCL